MEKIIKKNLFVDVTFKTEDKKVGKVKGVIETFYLIGILPLAVFYRDGSEERVNLNAAIEVPKDEGLVNFKGKAKKFTDKSVAEYFGQEKCDKIFQRLNAAVWDVANNKVLNYKPVEKFYIINYDKKKDGKSKGSKTERAVDGDGKK